MGIDNDSVLCLGVKLGDGDDGLKLFKDFLKKRNLLPYLDYDDAPPSEDMDEDDEYYEYGYSSDFYNLYKLVQKELKSLSSPFRLKYTPTYYDADACNIVVYVTHKDFKDTWKHKGLSISKALEILQSFDNSEFNAFLRALDIEEDREPRVFTLPHIT